ncbi:MAG: PP2C family protein-serine/threonine phosphatase [Oscillatoriales cyanobacterium SM2_1_8]|nr:PP2C family protein-serine/threonine phosphatase [Oscillatoriales cyanobacterium SM2_1_8]
MSVGKQQKSLVGLAALQAYRPVGRLAGVAISYITLDRIGEFLRTLDVSPNSRLFVMEPNGLLIGASTPEPLFALQGGTMARLAAVAHPQPEIAAAAASMQGDLTAGVLTDRQERTLQLAGESYWLTVTPYRDELGLVWWIAVVSPVADFMAPVRANAWQAVGLGTGALGVAILLAVRSPIGLVQPLLRLDRATQKLVTHLHGTLPELPPPPPVQELATLTAAFGTMAEKVQTAFQALEAANTELEDRVAARTAELSQANAQIQALNAALTQENQDMRMELAIARRLQQMILPSAEELAAIADLDIAAYMEPATQVGGDYYDVFAHQEGTRICIGDVTGHGLESGVIAIMVQSAMRALSTLDLEPAAMAVQALNRAIYQNVQRMHSDKNLSFLLLDYRHGWLSVTGQHETALVLRDDGSLESVDTLDLGFPIGLEEDIGAYVNQSQVALANGDLVLLYTDGIPEAENGDRQMYGLDRLVAVAQHHRQAPVRDIVAAITADLYRFIGDGTVYDDITLVVAKRK